MSVDTRDALRTELRALLEKRKGELESAGKVRTASSRIDRYVTALRAVLDESSLCVMDGALRCYNGRTYAEVSESALSVVLGNLLSLMGIGATDIKRIGDMPYAVIRDKIVEVDDNRISFLDRVYQISSGRRLPHSAESRTTYMLPYPIVPRYTVEKSLWEKFLEEVLPDENERMCLQEFFGMCYIDRRKLSIEKMALFVGTGANGKSVVFDVMKYVFGEEKVSFLSPDQLINEKTVVETKGKLLNFSPDIRRTSSFDSGLKALASSQDVQGWELYKGSTVVKCPPIVFAFNEMPFFKDVTDAFFRRLMVFGFDVTIPASKQDRALAAKICQHDAGRVFLWIMEGRKRLLENGGQFTHCAKMDRALAMMKGQVRKEMYPVRDWLEKQGWSIYPVKEGQQYDKVPASTIMEGLGGRLSANEITRELRGLGVQSDRSFERRYFLYKNNIS